MYDAADELLKKSDRSYDPLNELADRLEREAKERLSGLKKELGDTAAKNAPRPLELYADAGCR